MPRGMKIESFIRALRAVDLPWRLDAGGHIRCESGDCPILALGRARGKVKGFDDNFAWNAVGQRFGLDYDDGYTIIRAADGVGNMDANERKLRARMINSLGIEPEVAS